MPDYSIIIPAYNEEAFLPATLKAAKTAMAAQSMAGELLVVDNNSTDTTAAVATTCGACVVFEPHNQIARARNAGAHAAKGRFLIFLDADTLLPAELLQSVLVRLASDATAGGGATIRFDGPQSWFGEWCLCRWTDLSRTFGWAAGSFLFARADAFRAVDGFPHHVYAGEEIYLSRRLKRWARAHQMRVEIIPKPPVITSSRKLQWHPAWKVALIHALLGAFPFLVYSRRFCGFWYQRPADTLKTQTPAPPE